MNKKEIMELINNRELNKISKIRYEDSLSNEYIYKYIYKIMLKDEELALTLISLPDFKEIELPKQLKRNFLNTFKKNDIIYKAIENNKVKILQKLKEKNFNLEYKNNIGYNYLTLSIAKNKKKSTDFFINNYPDLITNKFVNKENNIFIFSEYNKSFEEINNLIKISNFDVEDSNNLFLEYCLEYNKKTFIKLILEMEDKKFNYILKNNNYNYLWKIIQHMEEPEDFNTFLERLNNIKNLSSIKNDMDLNIYEYSIFYLKNNCFKNYKDINIDINNIIKILSTKNENIDFSYFNIYNNTDNNLLYLYKNNILNIDKTIEHDFFKLRMIKTADFIDTKINNNNNNTFKNLQKLYRRNHIFIDPINVLNFFNKQFKSNNVNLPQLYNLIHKLEDLEFEHGKNSRYNKYIDKLLNNIKTNYQDSIIKEKNGLKLTFKLFYFYNEENDINFLKKLLKSHILNSNYNSKYIYNTLIEHSYKNNGYIDTNLNYNIEEILKLMDIKFFKELPIKENDYPDFDNIYEIIKEKFILNEKESLSLYINQSQNIELISKKRI